MAASTALPLTGCRLCGRGPVRVLTIRRHIGLLVVQRFIKFRGPLCREHGISLTKDYLLRTLWQGWWGYISFFVNFFVIGSNLIALSKAKKHAEPQALQGLATPTTAPQVDAGDSKQRTSPDHTGQPADAGTR